ncbi:MAG: SMP-30/gluconolactonase/LRE family protein, partial [Cyanobacteria bacterium J06558_2]
MVHKANRPQLLIDCNNSNAENPLWHPKHQSLYWTDIPCGRMFRYDFTTDTYKQIYSGEPVGGFTIQEDGSLLLFKTKGTVEIWHQGQTATVVDSIPEAEDTRFNDAIADLEGRVYSGTIATENTPGKLYLFDTDGSYKVVAEDILLPNGMGFNRDYSRLYFTDSHRRTVSRFDCDRATGELSNRQVLIKIADDEGLPDGLTVDNEDYIWSARWDGG